MRISDCGLKEEKAVKAKAFVLTAFRLVLSAFCFSTSAFRNPLDFGEHDHEREEHQRLDERQTDNHNNLDPPGCSRIARRALNRRRSDASLAECAESRRDSETKPGGEFSIAENRRIIR